MLMNTSSMAFTIFLALLFTLLCGASGNQECPDNLTGELAYELGENRQVVIDSLLKKFSGIVPKQDLANSSLQVIYEAFSKKFSRNTTKIGYCHFLESLNMISAYYHEASYGTEMQSNLVDVQLETEGIHSLVQNFNAAYGTKNSVELCDMFAKILKIKDSEVADNVDQKIQRRQTDSCSDNNCTCPEGGINSNELLCPCQFFDCLDVGRNLLPVFEGFEGLECLAFVVDTTGSMKDEIDMTIQIIKDMIASEENGCYILVPFNDDGHSNSSVGNVTLTYVDDSDPYSIQSLHELVTKLESSFQENSGGDCPEFCYDAIREAVNTEDKEYGYPVMVSGSQIIVITDAPSKGAFNAANIIDQASSAEVCIHFFLGKNSYNCFDDVPHSIDEYRSIANETGGTIVESKFDFSTFVHRYRNAPCGFLEPQRERRRRSVEKNTGHFCHNISVATLACQLSLTVETNGEVVTLTKPDQEQINIAPTSFKDTSEQIALFSESHPTSGEWTVCANGPIDVSVDFQMCIDIAPFYIMNTKEGKAIFTAATPPGCTLARTAILSSRTMDISSPVLSTVDRTGSPASQATLETCGNSEAMSGNITMPRPGTYYYKLEGEDTTGTHFSHMIQRKINIQSGDYYYNLTGVGPEEIEITTGNIAVLSFKLSSANPFGPVSFNLAIEEDISIHSVQPSKVEIAYGESVDVTVRVRPIGATQRVTLTASNECSTITSEKTITATEPTTTAPVPDACEPSCLNGGTCTTIRRRQREFHICRCASGYNGRACENVRN